MQHYPSILPKFGSRKHSRGVAFTKRGMHKRDAGGWHCPLPYHENCHVFIDIEAFCFQTNQCLVSHSKSTWVAPRIHRASARELHTLVCWGWPAATNSVGLASFPQISDNSIICCPRKAPNTIKYSWISMISMATLPRLHCSHYVPRCCFRLTYHDNKQPVSMKTDLSSCARVHLGQMQNMVAGRPTSTFKYNIM